VKPLIPEGQTLQLPTPIDRDQLLTVLNEAIAREKAYTPPWIGKLEDSVELDQLKETLFDLRLDSRNQLYALNQLAEKLENDGETPEKLREIEDAGYDPVQQGTTLMQSLKRLARFEAGTEAI